MAVELLKLQLMYHNFAFKKSSLIKLFLLATAMAIIPCFNLLIPINGCDPSWTIETAKVRLNSSDLDAAFSELIAANWLINGYETLSIGRDSARAVMVLRKLGFADAMGLYRSCSSLFGRAQRLRALPFKEGSFDFVFSTEMIDGVRVPARMVLEMERVLRPARVGVVMRRVTGNFPSTAVMKAAAPVAAFLRFSDVVAVRTVNCTVLVVFKKRTIVGNEKHKSMEQSKAVTVEVMTKKPRDSTENYVGTHATVKKERVSTLAVVDMSVARKSVRGRITEIPRDFARNSVGTYGTLEKKAYATLKKNAGVLITDTPRKFLPNYPPAYATQKLKLMPIVMPLSDAGQSSVDGKSARSLITEMPRDTVGSYVNLNMNPKERYLLNMPPFGTKKRYGSGG